MPRNWTAAQQRAIDCRGKTLLVSAAAGSGKTAVLTERVIRRLTDRTNPIELSRMLVVTFTRAAAQELREKIGAALAEALQRNPGDPLLIRQMTALGNAHISTIHSFCYDMIRSHFELLGLRADTRIADDTEINFLRGECMSATLDAYYDGEWNDIADIGSLVDLFVTDRDDRFETVMLEIYRKVTAYPEGISFFDQSAQALHSAAASVMEGMSPLQTTWGKSIVDTMLRYADAACVILRRAVQYLGESEKTAHAYMPRFEEDLNCLTAFAKALREKEFEAAKNVIGGYQAGKLGALRAADKTEETVYYAEFRSGMTKKIRGWAQTYFTADEGDIARDMQRTAAICEDLYRFLSRFEARFTAEKQSRGILDFADLERLTLRLLTEGEAAGSISAETAARFDEIYIDEYQDVNELQDRIFCAIARPNNRFLVGDIKQSIYGFRGAEPALFAQYRASFPLYREEDDALTGTLFLPDNFRCDRPIIDFTNAVFGILFPHGSGRVPYGNEDALVFGRPDGAAEPPPVTVALVAPEEEETPEEAEAAYVVAEIRHLLVRGYRPSDIAILVRSKKTASFFEKALTASNVAFFNTDARDFFENAEIQLMMCLLNIIDNPMRDIYLAGALRSPIFGITLDDLIAIRHYSEEGCLYEALCRYSEEKAWEPGRAFLKRLHEYREYARAQSVDRLIWYLFYETGILTLADRAGKGGRANLMLLYEYARRFEAGSFRGLYPFIRNIADIINSDGTLTPASGASESSDCVKIMSIHHAKGLQFPICFLCGTGKHFNGTDVKANFQLDRHLGIGMKLRDSTGYARYDTFLRRALSAQAERAEIDEEMCVLYVALTRAQNRLYVTGSDSEDHLRKLCTACAAEADYLSRESFARMPTYLKWILLSMAAAPCDSVDMVTVHWEMDAAQKRRFLVAVQKAEGTEEVEIAEAAAQERTTAGGNDFPVGVYAEKITERLSYVYAHRSLADIPAKLSVSRLYPGIIDDAVEAVPALGEALQGIRRRPTFLEPTPEGASAADRGTATHAFLQFCDFERLRRYGPEEELSRLINERYLSPQIGALVSCDILHTFLKSELFRELTQAEKVWRELRFAIRLEADRFAEREELRAQLQGETMLVQGIIDCIYLTASGELCLVDYKTDAFASGTSPETIRETLRRRHARQLTYYYHACRSVLCRLPDHMYVYSFALGEKVEIMPLFDAE